MRIIIIFIFLMLSIVSANAVESDLLKLSEHYYKNGEYFHSITELMRYQYLNQKGDDFPKSMILMGKSYYRGGNVKKAQMLFKRCYYEYPKTSWGMIGLYYSGSLRLFEGAAYFAMRDFQEYNYVFEGKKYYEDSLFNLCTAYAITENYSRSKKCFNFYEKTFPRGKYFAESKKQKDLIGIYENRQRKNVYIAGLSSAIIPGSGYLYTGKYELGIFSMLTNATLLYLIYDSYKKKNTFRMIFFSVFEFSFYNYSIVGSINSAREYNENYNKDEFLMGIKREF